MRTVFCSYEVGLEGITPILLHRCVLDKESGSDEEGYKEEWVKGTYVDSKGFVIWPSMNIDAAILAIPRTVKLVNQLTNKKESAKSILTSGIQIREFEIPFLIEGKKITIEDIRKNNWLFTCPAVVKGNRILRTRTCLPSEPTPWYLDFTIDLINQAISEKFLRDIIDDAGWKFGFGDQRPGSPKRPGKFGQFYIKKWERID